MRLVELDHVQTEVMLVKFQFLLKTEQQYRVPQQGYLITIEIVLSVQLAMSSYVLTVQQLLYLSLIHI